jgi:hypothetical protein
LDIISSQVGGEPDRSISGRGRLPQRAKTVESQQGPRWLDTTEPFSDSGIMQKVLGNHRQPAMAACWVAERAGRSHSASFDHRRLPETLRTAIATAYDYMMRSGRMSDERLREIAPEFMTSFERSRR